MGEILQEKWIKGVAVTATVLAVLTAIASSRGAAVGAQIQLLTSQEGSKWAFYQAKSIKQHVSESLADEFEIQIAGPGSPEQKELLSKKLDGYRSEIARYDKEKAQIQTEAEQLQKDGAVAHRRANQFSLAVVLFQIGIMLTSVSALVKRKELWIFGILFGLGALVVLANGLLLFY